MTRNIDKTMFMLELLFFLPAQFFVCHKKNWFDLLMYYTKTAFMNYLYIWYAKICCFILQNSSWHKLGCLGYMKFVQVQKC